MFSDLVGVVWFQTSAMAKLFISVFNTRFPAAGPLAIHAHVH